MATGAGAVNIRLGAIITDFLSSMRGAGAGVTAFAGKANTDLAGFYRAQDAQSKVFSKGLGRLGDDLTGLGKKLSAVSLGAGIVGAAMFSTYADLDGLTRGFKALSGSTQVAESDFKAFREIAKLPGLGLQEAEEAGLRMKALGYSTREAVKDLKEIGNAIALGGKGKAEFDSVLNQITQMSSKSKVLAEDLKPIVNASPVIAKVVSDTFGTVDSEQISKKLQQAGKTPKDFIDILVDGLSKLERVSGGPKNAIENLGDSFKIASFEFGKAADKTLDVTGKLNGLGETVTGLAEGFGGLPAPAQSLILALGGVALATGPVLIGVGGLIKTYQALTTTSAALTGVTGALKLGFTTLTGPIGIAVAAGTAVVALGYSLYEFNRTVDSSIDKQALLADATAQVQRQIGEETSRLKTLVAVAKDEKLTKEARLGAIREINAISPKYLGDLTLETINTDKATQAIARYTKVLTLKAKAQVFAQKAAEAEAEVALKRSQIPEPTLSDRVAAALMNPGDPVKAQGEAWLRAAQRANGEISKLEKQANFFRKGVEGVNAELDKMGELLPAAGKAVDFSGDGLTQFERDKARLKELQRQMEDYKAKGVKAPKAIADEFERLSKKVKEVKDAFKTTSASTSTKQYSAADIAKNAVKALDNEIKSLEITGKKVSSVFKDAFGNAIPLEDLRKFKGVWMDMLGLIKKTELPDLKGILMPTEIVQSISPGATPFPSYGLGAAGAAANAALGAADPKGKPRMGFDLRLRERFREKPIRPLTNLEAALQVARDNAELEAWRKGTVSLQEQYELRLNALGDFNRGMRDIINQGLGEAVGGLSEIVGGLVTGTEPLSNLPKFLLGTLGSVAQQLGRLAIGIGVGLKGIKAALASLNPVVAIAAGAGLIALGAVLKTGAAKIGGQIGGGGGSVRAFAKGGIARSTTLGVFAEYPGAQTNPEIVSPLNDLTKILQPVVREAVVGLVPQKVPTPASALNSSYLSSLMQSFAPAEVAVLINGQFGFKNGALTAAYDYETKMRRDRGGRR